MDRRKFLAVTSTVLVPLTAACSSDSDGDGTLTETASPTQTPTPSPTATPILGRITSVEVTEVPDYGLNKLGFMVELGELESGANYRVRITVESDAGEETAVFGVRSIQGQQSPISGGEMTPAEGTDTDGTELDYRVELRKEGETVDTRSDTIEYE